MTTTPPLSPLECNDQYYQGFISMFIMYLGYRQVANYFQQRRMIRNIMDDLAISEPVHIDNDSSDCEDGEIKE